MKVYDYLGRICTVSSLIAVFTSSAVAERSIIIPPVSVATYHYFDKKQPGVTTTPNVNIGIAVYGIIELINLSSIEQTGSMEIISTDLPYAKQGGKNMSRLYELCGNDDTFVSGLPGKSNSTTQIPSPVAWKLAANKSGSIRVVVNFTLLAVLNLKLRKIGVRYLEQ
ncbi:MAG: hypothetical protein AABZ06_07190 [Bdellovibrionota bacterium]